MRIFAATLATETNKVWPLATDDRRLKQASPPRDRTRRQAG